MKTFEKFTLEIEMGNDAMQDKLDICRALNSVATAIELNDKGNIYDVNGNKVGFYKFIREEE